MKTSFTADELVQWLHSYGDKAFYIGYSYGTGKAASETLAMAAKAQDYVEDLLVDAIKTLCKESEDEPQDA